MKSHELAHTLLAGPNLPVVINGWGSDEGFTFEVNEVSPAGTCCFSGVDDTKDTPRDSMGYQLPRECLTLYHGRHTPYSDEQNARALASEEERAELKRTDPAAYARRYAEIVPLTPEDMLAMAKTEEALTKKGPR